MSPEPVTSAVAVHWPPLRFERPETEKAATVAELSKTPLTISDITSRDGGNAVRNVHARSRALIDGELRMRGDAVPPAAPSAWALVGGLEAGR